MSDELSLRAAAFDFDLLGKSRRGNPRHSRGQPTNWLGDRCARCSALARDAKGAQSGDKFEPCNKLKQAQLWFPERPGYK